MLDDCPPVRVAMLLPHQPLQMEVRDFCANLRQAVQLARSVKNKNEGHLLKEYEDCISALSRRRAPPRCGPGATAQVVSHPRSWHCLTLPPGEAGSGVGECVKLCQGTLPLSLKRSGSLGPAPAMNHGGQSSDLCKQASSQ